MIKQRAVDAEDFETAAMVRTQLATFREKVYIVLGVYDAVEKGRLRRAEPPPPPSPVLQHAVPQHQLPRTPPLPQIGSSVQCLAMLSLRFFPPASANDAAPVHQCAIYTAPLDVSC